MKILCTAFASLALAISATAQSVEPATPKAPAAAEAHKIITEGVQPGVWTMDYDAALAYAKEKNLPVILDFTGSDWCGYCIKMDRNVFSKAEFRTWAKDNAVLVVLDFPNDKSKVPEKYVARNQALAENYGIQGYPTYVILDGSNGAEIGRLSAEQSTPTAFIAAMKQLQLRTAAGMQSFVEGCSAANKAKATATTEKLAKLNRTVAALKAELAFQEKVAAEAEKDFDALIEAERIIKLGPKAAEYEAAKKDVAAAETALQEFLAGQPERNEENQQKFMKLRQAIEEAKSKISSFE